MLETNVFHALGLHMHQPPGNLELLIEADPWEAEQIIRCYERPARYARQYADVGHLHIGFSGILLEQLRDPNIVDRYRHIIDIPAMLAAYREAPNVELIGMGHFHPIFPLIPPADWEEQLILGRDLMVEIFGRAPRGFWPPEMAFSMEMIPALVRAGYAYVVVDGVHVTPEDGVLDVFRPYRACFDGACITVVPRDRDVSNAQESGLDAAWFAHEVTHRCRFSPRPHEPRLVTTWSDGENGGWFRQLHEGSGFFGHYFAPYAEHVRGGEYPIRPVNLSAYLAEHPPVAEAQVQTGAWNVGSTSGFDFSQWAGSPGQRQAGEAVTALSQRWWALSAQAAAVKVPDPAITAAVAEARRAVLLAETSCYLFWGDDWLPRLALVLNAANARLAQIEEALASGGAVAAGTAAAPKAAVVKDPNAVAPPAGHGVVAVPLASADPAARAFPNTAPSDEAGSSAAMARSPVRASASGAGGDAQQAGADAGSPAAAAKPDALAADAKAEVGGTDAQNAGTDAEAPAAAAKTKPLAADAKPAVVPPAPTAAPPATAVAVAAEAPVDATQPTQAASAEVPAAAPEPPAAALDQAPSARRPRAAAAKPDKGPAGQRGKRKGR